MKPDFLPLRFPNLNEILDCSPLKLPVETPLQEALTQMNSVSRQQCQLSTLSAETQLYSSKEYHYSYILAVAGEQLVGIFTETDLVKIIASGVRCTDISLTDALTTPLITFSQGEYHDIYTVLSRLKQHHIRHLPVMSETGQLLGVISPETLGWILEPMGLLRLSTVSEVMNTQVIQIHSSASVMVAIESMAQSNAHCVVIVEPQPQHSSHPPQPVGIITERDIVRYQVLGLDFSRLKVTEVMTTPPLLIDPTESLSQAHQQMLQKPVRQLIVVGELGELLGVLTQSDLFNLFNRMELYSLVNILQQKITELECNSATTALIKLNQELEKRVEERTLLLKQTNQQLREEVLERQQAEQQLRQSLKALSDIKYALDQSDIIAFTDAQGVITEVNDQFCKISQYRRDELLGQTHKIVNSGYHSHQFFQQMWQTIQQGRIWRGEIKNKAKDGSLYWVSTVIVPFLDSQGQPTQYLAIRTDITSRKQAEEALKHQHLKSRLFAEITLKIRQSLKLQEILQTTVDEVQGILKTQRVLIYQLFPNGTGCIITEKVKSPWQSILNHEFSESLIFKEYRQQYLQGQAKAIDNIKAVAQEMSPDTIKFLNQFKIRSQLIVPIVQEKKLWGFIIAHQCDSPRHWQRFEVELMEQITLQVGIALSQAELLEKEKELSELKSRFITMASHELRTPLSLISSSAGILNDYCDRLTPQLQDKHLNRIFSGVNHITQLLEDVLTINRTESKQFQLNLKPLELVLFCSNLVTQIQAQTQKHHIQFTAIDEDKQTHLSTFVMPADEIILQKIFTNLLSNSVKYSPQGGNIDFNIIRRSQTLIFQCKDRGIGILPEDKPRIFESFHRGKNVGTIKGTGLGLTIVKRYVELHQGSIQVSSDVGKGTNFQVQFKIDQ